MKKHDKIDYSDIPETDMGFWKNVTICLPKRKQDGIDCSDILFEIKVSCLNLK